LAAVAILLARIRNHWFQQAGSFEYTMFTIGEYPVKDDGQVHQSWADLPPVVQRYFNGVFFPIAQFGANEESPFHPDHVPMVQSLRFQQDGQFAAKKGSWLPFTAHQTVSAIPGNPGFVWVAGMDTAKGWLTSWMPKMLVCDAWVKGEGHMLLSLHGLLTLVSEATFAKHKDALRKGEMMRWLAEAFLTPTALLPEAGFVFWKAVPGDPDRAMLSMIDPFYGSVAELEIDFDHDNSIEIKGVRPAVEGNSVVDRSWVGRITDFHFVENMWVPMYAEVGWVNDVDGELDLYFAANMTAMRFERAHAVSFDRVDATSTQ
jgi:hypothetical protein